MRRRHRPKNALANKSFQGRGRALPNALSWEETGVLRNSKSEHVAGARGEVQGGLEGGQATASMGVLPSIRS